MDGWMDWQRTLDAKAVHYEKIRRHGFFWTGLLRPARGAGGGEDRLSDHVRAECARHRTVPQHGSTEQSRQSWTELDRAGQGRLRSPAINPLSCSARRRRRRRHQQATHDGTCHVNRQPLPCSPAGRDSRRDTADVLSFSSLFFISPNRGVQRYGGIQFFFFPPM